MEKRIETLLDWIEYREVRGYYTFTKEDIERQFPAASKVYMKTALHRLVAKSRIISPWRNFYVIMPVEYLLKGIIPRTGLPFCSFQKRDPDGIYKETQDTDRLHQRIFS